MGKQSGLGDGLWIGGHDLSGDIGAVSNVGGGLAGTQDVTGINKLAPERVGLERDGRIEFSAFFNPDLAIGAHAHRHAARAGSRSRRTVRARQSASCDAPAPPLYP